MGNQVSRVKYDTPYDLSSKPDPHGSGHFKFTQNGTTYRNLVAIRMLGSGGVGRVFLVKDADANQHYALKVIDNQLTDERVHDIRGALALVRFVSKSSPFAKVFESYYYNSGLEKSLYIVLHYYEHGSLDAYLRSCMDTNTPIPQHVIERIAKNIFKALHALHSRKPNPVIHGDVSVDNCLVHQMYSNGEIEVVLNDMDTNRDKHLFRVGKPSYLAPEIRTGEYSTSVDIWSSGIMLYELMTLSRTKRPHQIVDEMTEKEHHGIMRLALHKSGLYDTELIECVLSMMKFNPSSRPNTKYLHTLFSKNYSALIHDACKQNDLLRLEWIARKDSRFINHIMNAAAASGQLDIVKLMLERGATSFDKSMKEACRYNHREIVDLMIEKGARDWNPCFAAACVGGHLDLVELMISKGANDWNRALCDACANGHTNVMNLLIRHGANNFDNGLCSAARNGHVEIIKELETKYHANDWDKAMSEACEGGHIMIVAYAVTKGANTWDCGLRSACLGGNTDVVELMIKKGATDWQWGLWNACKGGHPEIAHLMIQKGANTWNKALAFACKGGHLEIVDMILNKGATNVNQGMWEACKGGHRDVVEYMISRGANDFNQGLLDACTGGHKDIAEIMVARGANSWNRALFNACLADKYELVEYMLAKGANDLQKAVRYAQEHGLCEIEQLLQKHEWVVVNKR